MVLKTFLVECKQQLQLALLIQVMEILGPSISQLRHRQKETKVPLSVGVNLGIQMVKCMEIFHNNGFVHRDVKPSNFVCGLTAKAQHKQVFVIDFGLCKEFKTAEGIVPQRDRADFRGTSMYASIHAHKEQDLAPRDDMWSLLYIIVDLLRGELPWKEHGEGATKNREKAAEMKVKCYEDPAVLVKDTPIPSQLLQFAEHLKSLKYEDFPDYKKLCSLLESAPANTQSEQEGAFQWDVPELTERQNIPAIDDFSSLLQLSEKECAKEWPREASSILSIDNSHINEKVLVSLLAVAQKHNTFFTTDIDTVKGHSWVGLQHIVHRVEERIRKARSKKRSLPKITGFSQSQQERPGNPKHLRKTLSQALFLR